MMALTALSVTHVKVLILYVASFPDPDASYSVYKRLSTMSN